MTDISSFDTRTISKELQKRDVSLLHANVLLGAPLPVVQFLYHDDQNPNKLTEEVLIDSIFEGSPGVLTFLAEKYKSKYCSSDDGEDVWSALVKKVKNHAEWEKEYNRDECGIGSLYVSRYDQYDFRDEGRCALEEFMEVFPELIAVQLGTYSPIELCFKSHHLDQTKHFVSKILATPKTTYAFDLSPWDDYLDRWPELEFELDGDCMEALAGIFKKYNELHFVWFIGWNREFMEKFIRLLFQSTTTLKRLRIFSCSEFSRSMKHILPSIKEEQLSCPLEDVIIECDENNDYTNDNPQEAPCFLFPFLPHMPKLLKLTITPTSHTTVDWAALQHIVASGPLKILHIATKRDLAPGLEWSDPILAAHIMPIFEAARCSQSLLEISVLRSMHEVQRDKIHSNKTLQMCMLDILQHNTVLTSVIIGPEADELLSRKIDYLGYLNQYGRRGIREETTTLLQFLNVLGEISENHRLWRWEDDEDSSSDEDSDDNDEQEKYEHMQLSLLYGVLRERPPLWVENVLKSASKCTGKRKRCETDTNKPILIYDTFDV